MSKFVHFGIDLAGKPWHADWSIDGKDLVVRSAYGPARRAPLGRAKPENLAKKILRELVTEWRNKQRG